MPWITCGCGYRREVPPGHLGDRIRCPKCDEMIAVFGPARTASGPAAPEEVCRPEAPAPASPKPPSPAAGGAGHGFAAAGGSGRRDPTAEVPFAPPAATPGSAAPEAGCGQDGETGQVQSGPASTVSEEARRVADELLSQIPGAKPTAGNPSMTQEALRFADRILSRLPGESRTSPPPAAQQPSLPTFGKYVLLREVGRGGMGIVWEAQDTQLGRRVALKTLFPNAQPEEHEREKERFLREGRLSASLPKHPNIVSVYEAGEIDGRLFLAMEFIPGKPLNEWWKSVPSLRRRIAVLRDVALGVHHAHEQRVIHRDLKPQNVLVDARGCPHVTDFGLAKKIGAEAGVSLTVSGAVIGTPLYMSPEQAMDRPVDHRSDIYSLGVILYEMLTGKTPFAAESVPTLLLKVVQDPVPPPSTNAKAAMYHTVDQSIEAVCLKALAKNPADRYPTAQALAEDLTRWLEGNPVLAAGSGMRQARVCPACFAPNDLVALVCGRCGGRLRSEGEDTRLERKAKLAYEAMRAEAEELGGKGLYWTLVGLPVPFAPLVGLFFSIGSVRRSLRARVPVSGKAMAGILLGLAYVAGATILFWWFFSLIDRWSSGIVLPDRTRVE